MARFLLLAKDLPSAGRFEGDPVSIKDDLWQWSAAEDVRQWVAEGNAEKDYPDVFYTIDIFGMPVVTAKRITYEWKRAATVLDIELAAPDEADRYVFLGPHRWQFGVADKLPGNLRAKLRKDRFLDIPFDIPAINSYVTDRAGLDVWITDTPIDP